MKKRFKKYLCLAIAFALMLTSGCTKGNAEKGGAMGRYVEEDMTLPQGLGRIVSFTQDKEAGFSLYSQKLGESMVKYISKDGKSWTEEKAPWLEALHGAEGAVNFRALAYGSDGSIYTIFLSDKTSVPHLVKTSDEKTYAEIAIGDWKALEGKKSNEPVSIEGGFAISSSASVEVNYKDGMDIMRMQPRSLAIADNGDILIGYFDKPTTRYSPTDGKEITGYPGVGDQIVSLNGQLIQLNEDRSAIVSYNLQDGSAKSEIPYEGANTFNMKLAGKEDGTFYLADASGISRVAPGGAIWEKLLDGNMATMGMPSVGFEAMIASDNEEFYILYNTENGKNFSLVHYVYDANMPTAPDTELVVYGLKDNRTVRQAIGEFQRANPQVKVNFRVAMGEDSTATPEDIIRSLNTEILGGKGPDILILDGLPIDSYIEKDVLMDISEVVNPLITANGLISEVIKSFERDGKLYGVPTRFSMPFMIGEKNSLRDMTSLSKIVEEGKKDGAIPYLSTMPDKEIFKTFYGPSVMNWLGEDGKIIEEELSAFLKDMKAIHDLTANKGDEMATMTMAVSSVGGSGGFEEMPMGAYLISEKICRFNADKFTGPMGITSVVRDLGKLKDYDITNLFKEEGAMFYPTGVIGISNGSQQKDLAAEFINMLLSPKIQDLPLYDGLSVSRSGVEKNLKSEASGIDCSTVLNMIDNLKTPLVLDSVIENAVQEITIPLFKGEKTPEEAAKAVVEKVNLYLAE